MNSGLNVLEFQALAVDPNDPNDIIGGTQDNGSPTFDGNQWRMDVLGDGGPTGIDIDGKVHYHQYSGVSLQVNWDGIDPTPGHWMWISDSMRASGEGASFYPPLDRRPGRQPDRVLRDAARLAHEDGRRCEPRLHAGALRSALRRPRRHPELGLRRPRARSAAPRATSPPVRTRTRAAATPATSSA